MAKPRKLKKISKRLTELLDIDELTAIGGDDYDINAMSPDTALPVCVECEGPVENHGRFERTLTDIVTVNGKKQFAKLHYAFYKYRCLDPECGTIFQKPISFVKENSKTTKRYENEVLRHVMFESIDKTRNDMKAYVVGPHESDVISKPAISKLIKRWVQERDDSRRFLTPAVILIYTYETCYRSYTVIYTTGDNPLSIVEVLPGISAAGIKQYFSKIEVEYVYGVVVDCNPVIFQAVKEMIPASKIMVDTDAVKKILYDEYDDCIFERAKNYSKEVRRNLHGSGVNLNAEDAAKVYRIRQDDTVLNNAYMKYAVLFNILQEHRDILEIKAWLDDLDAKNKEIYAMTMFYLESYWSEIVNYYKRRSNVEGSTYEKLYALNDKIEAYFSQCTDDIFRARMLYSDFKEIEGSWKGMPVDVLLDKIDDMITEGGLKKHERKRR